MLNKPSLFKTIFASSLGGALEMYDFVIYIFFAPIIAKLFFSNSSHLVSLIAAFGVFAAGYLVRPIGGLLFGMYGDQQGRKSGLIISMSLMGTATVLMGCLPTAQSISIWAPILLVALRLIQGIAVGGDFPGAMTFVAESSTPPKRGLSCSWTYVGINFGTLVASGFVALLTNILSQSAMLAYGWRIAFFSSLIILLLGFYFRKRLAETHHFLTLKEQQQLAKNPLKRLLQHSGNYKQILIGLSYIWLGAVVISQIFLYMPTYLHLNLQLPLNHALSINTWSLLTFTLLIPVFGFISDKIGHKRLGIMVALAMLIGVYPAYWLIVSNHYMAGLLLMDIIAAGIIALMPVLLPELFPTQYRFTGAALSYNISFAIFGGLTPLFLTYLLHQFHNPTVVAINLIVASALALMGVVAYQDQTGQPLK